MRNIYKRNEVMVVLGVMLFLLSACGKETDEAINESEIKKQRVVLQKPTGMSEESLWTGVSEEKFIWQSETEETELSRSQLESYSALGKTPGVLSYRAYNENKRLLLTADKVVAAGENPIYLSLRRTLE